MCIIVAAKVDTRNGESPASPDVLSYSRLGFWPRKVCTAESSGNQPAEDRAQKCKHSLLAPCSFSSSKLLEKVAALHLVLCLGLILRVVCASPFVKGVLGKKSNVCRPTKLEN